MSSRALAIGGRILLILLATVGLLWPLAGSLVTTTAGAADDPVVITELRSAFTVAADGHMAVTEQITADFPGDRHGIFRYWDVSDPSDPGARHIPTIREITVDGAAGPVRDVLGGRSTGSWSPRSATPTSTSTPGEHTYTITYAIDGVISQPAAGAAGTFASSEGENTGDPGSAFYWNVVAQGWEMPIRKARIAISLPSPSGQVQCSAGTDSGPRALRDHGRRALADLVLTATGHPAADRDDGARRPWLRPPRTGRACRGPSGGTRSSAVPSPCSSPCSSCPALALVAGIAWGRVGREESPGFPVMYAPPEGLGPVQTVYMASESHGPGGAGRDDPVPGRPGVRDPGEPRRGLVADRRAGAGRAVGRARPGRAGGGPLAGHPHAGSTFAADGSIAAGKTLREAGRPRSPRR